MTRFPQLSADCISKFDAEQIQGMLRDVCGLGEDGQLTCLAEMRDISGERREISEQGAEAMNRLFIVRALGDGITPGRWGGPSLGHRGGVGAASGS